jgi:mannobiose 2-epimerase
VQAETVIGYANLFQHFGDERAAQRSLDAWTFIKRHIVDRENGEWRWSVHEDGSPNTVDDKAGFWKCPYHNGRMCMEIMERFSE